MSTFNSTDYSNLNEFLLNQRRNEKSSFMHPGVFIWRFFGRDPHVNPERDFQFWNNQSGELIAFAWFTPPEDFDIQIDPNHMHDELMGEIVAWCENRMRQMMDDIAQMDMRFDRPIDEAIIHVNENDTKLIQSLKSNGYQQDDTAHFIIFTLDLSSKEIDASDSNAGFSIREFKGESEIDKRVELHHHVWGDGVSSITPGSYRNMINADGYSPELDLVAVDEKNNLIGYINLWFDETNRDACIEPVGVSPDNRGRGVGSLLVNEGLNRVIDMGAERIGVRCYSRNEAGLALYTKVGFSKESRELLFYRSIDR